MVTAPKPDPANFRLSVKDFGPIVKADVDFRPLTVFVGPSNTGKSYLAVLTYALHQALMEEPAELRLSYRPRRMHRLFRDITKKDARIIQAWADDADSNSNNQSISQEIAEIIRGGVENYFRGIRDRIVSELQRCFGIEDISQFYRKPAGKDAIIQFYKNETSTDKHWFSYEMLLKKGASSDLINVPAIPSFPISGDIQQSIEILQSRSSSGEDIRYLAAYLAESATESVFSRIIGALNYPIYYLPADRAGVMHAHRTVMSALVQRAQYAGIRRDESVILLSGVLGDFLQHLIEVGQNPRRPQIQKRHFSNTATALESHVMKGIIRNVRSQTEYPSFTYRPNRWAADLPLLNSSSMVSELAPVVLFLRYIVKPSAVLIIEEPESHLHPAMQVEFTRLLAGAVKAGLRVILTTHSEWVVETVGNLVELWGVPEGRRESLPGGAYALPPEDVGVWLFREEGESGSVVTEVKRDLDTGVYGIGYDDVAIALNNEWANAAPEKTDSR